MFSSKDILFLATFKQTCDNIPACESEHCELNKDKIGYNCEINELRFRTLKISVIKKRLYVQLVIVAQREHSHTKKGFLWDKC